MKARFVLALGFVVLAASAAPLAGGCKTATQVTIDLRTVGVLGCSDLKGVDIIVADSPQAADARIDSRNLSASVERGQCADGKRIGTLVLTPTGTRGAVVVVARVDEGVTCTRATNFKGCIVARRAFAFIEHSALTMPISLEASCKDVPCDAITSCRTGTCVSSDATCVESTSTCDSVAEPVPLPDGGFVPPDAIAPDGEPSDGPPADGPIVDAPSDAPDSGDTGDTGDATTGLGGNQCPDSASKDCADTAAPLCCYMATFFCGTSASCAPYPKLECTGKKHCPGQYCCGTDPDGGAGLPTSTCGVGCTFFVCNTAADCPPEKPSCTLRYYPPGGQPGGPILQCQ